MASLTHLGAGGEANMVDVGGKAETERTAIAAGAVVMRSETLAMILQGDARKGDVLGTARIAGIMAAKRTHELIPLCHPLLLTRVSVDIDPDDALPGLRVTALARVTGKTGVEMEALTAAAVTCLTIYDMAKAVDRGMVISDIRLVEKTVASPATTEQGNRPWRCFRSRMPWSACSPMPTRWSRNWSRWPSHRGAFWPGHCGRCGHSRPSQLRRWTAMPCVPPTSPACRHD